MTATIMNELLSSSSLQTHIENVLQPTYQRRYNLMVEAIKGELLPLGVTMANGKDGLFGGYFIWIELPVDAGLVTSRAKSEEELIVAPGKIFEVQGDDSVKFPCGLRLCFSSEPEGRLSEGVKRLARVVKEILREEKGGSGANPGTHDMGELQ
jgi:DNA-binding transcriptional MocR family regulator